MSLVTKDNLKNILSNTKDNINNKINIMKPGTFYSIVNKYTKKSNLPYPFYQASASAVGTNIYLFGGYHIDGYDKYNHKYDTTTDTYSRMANIPFTFYQGSSVSIGTDIYLLLNSFNYKYDTTTGTYTKNTDIPYSFNNGAAVSIGTDIYVFGSYNSSYYRYNYKYDTITNTYTKNTDIPYNFYWGSAGAVENNIYLFGSGYYENGSYVYGQYAYKYDIAKNSYTKISNIPYDFCEGSAVAIGNDIYLLGGRSDYNKYNYKYDATNDSYTKNKDIPYGFWSSSAVLVNKDIYILGSRYGSYGQNNYIYSNYNITSMIKPTNHSIYTESKSYTDTASCIVKIEDNNYTEYNGNNIIKNTFSIDSNGNTKMYIKQGAILNGKEVTVDTEGWNTINLLDYL